MPNARARSATSPPTRPRQKMASVFSYSSTPVKRPRSHSWAFTTALAWATLRAQASMSAMVCSAALTMLEVGALHTMTPRSVAASTSTLSTPTPARPMTRRRPPASMTSRVTFVAERTMSPS